MSPNCSILASIFQWGGMPPDPPSSSMLRMLGSVPHTSLPKRLVSTGRKYYEFYVEMSPNYSILASIFQWGGLPPDPPSSSMLRMLGSVPHTSLPKRLVSTGRKYYEFYVEMSPNCSILASIFQWGGMPPDPPSSSMLCMLGSVPHTSLPKRLVP